MSDPESTETTQTKVGWPWQLKAGITLLALSSFCVAITVAMLADCYSAVAASSTSPKPSELAEGIANALRYSFPAAPLAVAGLTLLLSGVLRHVQANPTAANSTRRS